jgi:DNA polymerase III epsilon subunit-like protein
MGNTHSKLSDYDWNDGDKALPKAEWVPSCANMVDLPLRSCFKVPSCGRMMTVTMAEQFDMFSEQVSRDPVTMSPTLKTSKAKPSVAQLDEADMVRHLSETGRYRILEKLTHRAVVSSPRPEFLLKGIILDTETTGLNAHKNEIIEIGVIAFTFDSSGCIGDVTGVYGGLRQPSMPIPEEIIKLTGITDEMVAGQSIDMDTLRAMIEPADVLIAHNAGFDRPFCEALSHLFSEKAWACSNSEVNWASRGFEGTKLGYLIAQAGYFHDGHRAIDDCFALLEILARHVDGHSSTAFAELYEASQKSCVRIFAENSPFDMKEYLKARGYRWSDGSDGRPKAWWIEIGEEAVDEELRYLKYEIYRYADADPPIRRLTAYDRFRA